MIAVRTDYDYSSLQLGWHADCKLTAQRTSIVHLFSALVVAVTCE